MTSVADALRKNVRAVDSVARLGGDEFALLLPNTDATAAESVLLKLRQKLLDAMQQQGQSVTVSIGAAVFTAPLDSCSRMLSIADAVMYSVKARGKNALQIESAPPATTPFRNATE